ncbi:MAG: energy transducer TonB [Bacteroidota bacterium]
MKIKFLFLLFVTINVYCPKAQTDSAIKYTPPIFSNDHKALGKYVAKYIQYPRFAIDQGISDVVNATIYINKEGRVKFVNTLGKTPAFNAEAKRVLRLTPNWQPAFKNGVPIDTVVNQRVFFSLQKTNPEVKEEDIFIVIYREPLSNAEINYMIRNDEERTKKNNLAKKLNEEGSALLQLKKFDEALVKFNGAIEKGGNLNPYLYNRGLTYLNLNQDDKARADFLEAYRQGDEDSGKVYNDLFKNK